MADGGMPPPVGSLGCYKGVMLCNRPPEDTSRLGGGGGGDGMLPFRSMIAANANEPPGLPPAKDAKRPEQLGTGIVKTCGPSAALRRHCKWIKELQAQIRDEQMSTERNEKDDEVRKQRMQEAARKQRELIKHIKHGREPGTVNAFEIEAILDPKMAVRKAEIVNAESVSTRAEVAPPKPLWAMTEAEKDTFEDEQADDLIKFAEDLDYDKYVNDLEYRQEVQAVRDRAKKLQREQDAFKDALVREFNETDEDEDEMRSTSAGGSVWHEDAGSRVGDRRRQQRAGPDGSQPDWDSSTAFGEDPNIPEGREARTAAGRILEANPQLRSIHSKGSVQRIVERAQQQGVTSGDID